MPQTAAPLQSNQPGPNQIGQPGAPAQQQDTPLTVTPSPMQMPGAAAAMNAPQQTMHAPTEIPVLPNQQTASKDKQPEGEKPVPDSDALQARADGLQTLARKFEQSAKDNQADAEAFRKLQDLFGTKDGVGQVDPIAEIAKLRGELDSERTERVRAEVARLTGVPPSLIVGSDSDSMAASAQAALEWGKGLGGKVIGVPAVAPVEVVNSDGKPGSGKPQQITTRDELKGMSSAAIMEAYNHGQLDKMLGREA
jgi:hypothetical protein